jgi:hypothetical protein
MAGGDDDPGSAPDETVRDGQPDAPAGTGDERGLAG